MFSTVRRPLAATLTATVLVAVSLVAPAAHASGGGGPMDGWDPSYILADSVLDNSGTMNQRQIDEFLGAQGAACEAGEDGSQCLKDARFDTTAIAANDYCAAIPAGMGLSAGDVIHSASLACGINPQVLLVMLQKEQGLVTTTNPSQYMYERAMGFRCPDFQDCEVAYAGFPAQVHSAASRLNEYRARPDAFQFGVGRSYNVALHPDSRCGTWRIPMRSAATAALYNYTPYTPNPAAIDNPMGPGNSCSSYGNRNFYRTFNAWFGRPNAVGTPVGESRFVDLPGTSAFTPEINWLGSRAITNGWNDGTFRTHNPLTRAEFAAFLYRFEGRPTFTPPVRSPFVDLNPASDFYREITWMHRQGITTGWNDGTFRPQSPVLRDELAAFIYRYAGANSSSTNTGFSDISTNHPFVRHIAWMHDRGLTTGYRDGTYRPFEPVLREQVAAFLFRLDQYLS